MIFDKSSLIEDIETLLRDNGDQEISPKDLRDSLVNIIDSLHILSQDENIDTNNFGTPPDRNVRLGELALNSLGNPGRSASDTVAVGYKVLESNYNGIRNTGLGSFSMSCSVYGKENVGVGYGSMSGNVDGNYNVAVGNYGLYNNKHGRNNISIGHGAGYFAPNSDSWKFYVGSYDVGSVDVCEEISASGIQVSLMYGDLQENKLGIGVLDLDDIGTLQVGGHITTSGNANDIGTNSNPWRNIYVSNSINNKFILDDLNFNPANNGVQSLGGIDKRWNANFTDITVSGTADIETVNYTTITDNIYLDRTLYLASQGEIPTAYLNDGQIEGGGLVIQSSGIDYRRDYHWTFQAPNYDIGCIGSVSEVQEDFSRASWFSNISIDVEEGSHLRTNRVLSKSSLDLVKENNCYGIFIKDVDDQIVQISDHGNEKQILVVNAISGSYMLRFKDSVYSVGELSEAISYDATPLEVGLALSSIPDLNSNVLVSDFFSTNDGIHYSIEFINRYHTHSPGAKNVQILEVESIDLVGAAGTGRNRVYSFSFTADPAFGTFSIHIPGKGWVESSTLGYGSAASPAYSGNISIPSFAAALDSGINSTAGVALSITDAINDFLSIDNTVVRTSESTFQHALFEVTFSLDESEPLLSGNVTYESYSPITDGSIVVPLIDSSWKRTAGRLKVGGGNTNEDYIEWSLDTVKLQSRLYNSTGLYIDSTTGLQIEWTEPFSDPTSSLYNPNLNFGLMLGGDVALNNPDDWTVFSSTNLINGITSASFLDLGIDDPRGVSSRIFVRIGKDEGIFGISYAVPEAVLLGVSYPGDYPYSVWDMPVQFLVRISYSGVVVPINVISQQKPFSSTEEGGGWNISREEHSSNNSSSVSPSQNIVYFSKEEDISPDPLSVSGTIGNITNINMVSSEKDYAVSYSMTGNNSKISQKFRSRTATTKKLSYVDEVSHGFDISYIDENNSLDYNTQQKRDRLVVSHYDGTIEPLNALTLMKSSAGGLIGITDIFDQQILPETIMNVQSSGNADVRITGVTSACVQLLSGSNKLIDGAEVAYILSSEDITVSRFKNGVKSTVIRADENNNIAFDGYASPEKISIHAGDTNAVIALQESSMVEYTDAWGKVYVKEAVNPDQSQSLYFLDDENNEFNLVRNKFEQVGNNVYTDEYENTFVGDYSPEDRFINQSSKQGNTTLGYQSLNSLNIGDYNTVVGSRSGKNITSGRRNSLVGYNVGAGISTGSNSIIIGSDLSGTNVDNQFLVGSQGQTYLSGSMGDYKSLMLHNGSFTVTSGDEFDRLSMSYNKINLTDLSQEFPNQRLSIIFSGVDDEDDLVSNTLWEYDHSVAPMVNTTTYTDGGVPYAELYGDLRLRGSIRFSDGTSIDTVADTVVEGGVAITTVTNVNNTSVNVSIIKEADAITIPGNDFSDTFFLVSHSGDHGKMSLTTLRSYMSELDPRIVECDTGFNHVFTHNSSPSNVCNSIFIGSEAGHLADGWRFTTMIGNQAGYNATINYGGASEHGTLFIGYQSGKNSVGCYSSTFLGPNSGSSANGSFSSTFIGDQAGMSSQSSRSVGIGDNALESVIGEKNIELTSGVGGHLTTRLITGTASNKMNLGDTIGSDMSEKRVSIGAARVTGIGATIEVRPSTGTEKLQSWLNFSGVEVAYLDQSGNLYISGSVI